jgi:hypothetical protein
MSEESWPYRQYARTPVRMPTLHMVAGSRLPLELQAYDRAQWSPPGEFWDSTAASALLETGP